MNHQDWVARVQAATKKAARFPEEAASELLALTDEVEALLPESFSTWHLSQTLSVAAAILEDTHPEQALAATTRAVTLLRQWLVGVADHLCSAASHRALLQFQLIRDSEAKESVSEALRAAALAPNPNRELEMALEKLRERQEKRGAPNG